MKTHKVFHRPNPWGGYSTKTLCGRSSIESENGMNASGTDADVTCKFCLREMKSRTERSIRESSALVAKGRAEGGAHG
ncbi:hypothetical protein [Acidovorax sp. SUPP2539]|uniref:hypothetical protein n=1 Tax=Acidovorax sp. SUPP2539 TaxID=2920878 RepID=UPI0023DE24B0|nr:hypothetical protein [Acidovorax sp. SUPP2539]GKS92759.1 hypothetical protein AVTE2539_25360 [Acidovorax sp. SUPP2539]